MEIADVFGNLPFLETERLVLRKVTLSDAEDLYEYASDPEVSRYLPWRPHQSIEDSRQFLTMIAGAYDRAELAPWGLQHKEDRKFIGTITFHDWSIPDARAEIGYALSRSYWGKGLMTEAGRAVVTFGFTVMELNRIQARCIVENVGSSRVMEKIGMSYEGTLREYTRHHGESFAGIAFYAILRREYEALYPPPPVPTSAG
ncbi:MAG: GNAT family N-acetyltransferase [Anaerolineae bacterium]|nr:GNAT family N-acetyltransferase [Anaerolineae bacterium]